MNLQDFLNKQIANFALTYFKLHHFHWFIEGPGFFELHELFQDLYEEQTSFLDEFAERLLAIEGIPASKMSEYLQLSSLSEEGNETNVKDTMNALIKDFSQIAKELKEGIEIAEKVEDHVTADLFIRTKETLEKHVWMFKQTAK
ncbi:MAG: DNA starvation/stationary phase protection protein [Defluviitaleaceae bacterium]|nr:DNA starvation/stationary phase protection protein [Defluviitaleaceae bacterium]